MRTIILLAMVVILCSAAYADLFHELYDNPYNLTNITVNISQEIINPIMFLTKINQETLLKIKTDFKVVSDGFIIINANSTNGSYKAILKPYLIIGNKRINITANVTNFIFDRPRLDRYKFVINITSPKIIQELGFDIETQGDNLDIESYHDRKITIAQEDTQIELNFQDLPQSMVRITDDNIVLIINSNKIYIDPVIDISGSIVGSTSIAPLTENQFVVAWTDYTQNDVTFAIYYTNGTVIKAETDINTNIYDGSYLNQLSIVSFSPQRWAAFYHDGIQNDTTLAVYDNLGNQIGSQVDADTQTKRRSYVDSTALDNKTIAVFWYDGGDVDTTWAIYNISYDSSSPVLLYGPYDADTNGNSNTYNVAGCAVNNTHLAVIWYDSTDGHLEWSIVNKSNTATINSVDLETLQYNHIDCDAINGNKIFVTYHDISDFTRTIKTFTSSGTLINTLANIDGQSVSPEFGRLNDNRMILATFNSDNQIGNLTIFNSSIVGIADYNTSYVMGYYDTDVTHNSYLLENTHICQNNFMVVYADKVYPLTFNESTDTITLWDGICPVETDTTIPSFTINPTNISTTNQSAIITWTPSESANYTLRYTNSTDYTGGTLISNATSSALARNQSLTGLTNYTYYYINVSIWDTSGNYNQSNFSFRTAQTIIATDPCLCPSPAANWNIPCNTCTSIPTCDLAGYNIYLEGTGTIELGGHIYNVKNLYIQDTCDFTLNADYDIYMMQN